jgi:hypothetical protein
MSTHGLGSPWVANPSAHSSSICSSMPVYPGALSPDPSVLNSHSEEILSCGLNTKHRQTTTTIKYALNKQNKQCYYVSIEGPDPYLTDHPKWSEEWGPPQPVDS